MPGSSMTLAPAGQFFTQAQQWMQSAGSVETVSRTAIAAVGQSPAQVPHLPQAEARLRGDTPLAIFQSL